MTRAEAVERIIAGISGEDYLTRCAACGMHFTTTRLAHAAMHRKMRGINFWSHHSAFLGVVPVARNAPPPLRNGGRVEAWFLRRSARVLAAGWATRAERVLLVPLPLWDFLQDMTRRHRREETAVALLDNMLAEALQENAA